MKAKVAAVIVLIYSILYSVAGIYGALLARDISVIGFVVTLVMFIGPGIGVLRRSDWSRIWLGMWAVLFLGMDIVLPFREKAHFTPGLAAGYLAVTAALALPVYLLFCYRPLKEHTSAKRAAAHGQ